MKRVKDGRRVLMGQIATGTYSGSENKIQLFDGLFTTGWRITSFTIVGREPTGNDEVIAKISTEPKSSVSAWEWEDVQELAWAAWGIPVSTRFGIYNNVREGNMAIEDLWISAYSTGESKLVNYEIGLEKYSFAAWDGAGILVENLSQGGPQ